MFIIKKTIIRSTLICSLVLIFATGCNKSNFKELKIIPTDINFVRFEQELFEIDLYSFVNSCDKLKRDYPFFLPLFSNKIIEIGDTANIYFCDRLQEFTSDQAIYNTYKESQLAIPNLETQKEELTKAFGRWASIFPEKPVPDIYTYISGFNQTIVLAEHFIGISIEKYLGAKNELYNKVYPAIPIYQRFVMTPEKIPSDVIKSWSQTEISYSPEQNNLLSQMIFNGQIMFLTKQLLPETHDTLIWGYKPAQLEFCLSNEKQMWSYLIEQKLLFNTEAFKINQFINEAPFTKDFTTDSPGRAAVWIGYNIVKKYAEQNKGLTLREVVMEKNYQMMLNESRYRP